MLNTALKLSYKPNRVHIAYLDLITFTCYNMECIHDINMAVYNVKFFDAFGLNPNKILNLTEKFSILGFTISILKS